MGFHSGSSHLIGENHTNNKGILLCLIIVSVELELHHLLDGYDTNSLQDYLSDTPFHIRGAIN